MSDNSANDYQVPLPQMRRHTSAIERARERVTDDTGMNVVWRDDVLALASALEEVETVYARKNMEFAMMRRERDEAQRLQVLEWERAEAAERALAARDEALREARKFQRIFDSIMADESDGEFRLYTDAALHNANVALRAALTATEEGA